MPRLRVFAGPNGSGKSTIIKTVSQHTTNGKLLNLGVYINADDIAQDLKNNRFSFASYNLLCSEEQILAFAIQSGLLSESFSKFDFENSFELDNNKLVLKNAKYVERVAQIISRFLREAMLATSKSFSFETVFSHPSNVEIMAHAAAAGYKVYLYFVSTESPIINKARVRLRVAQKGHSVPPDKIESRYYRSLELMFDAAKICYQTYFFDNSGESYKLVANYKNGKQLSIIESKLIPKWFQKYYLEKVANNNKTT